MMWSARLQLVLDEEPTPRGCHSRLEAWLEQRLRTNSRAKLAQDGGLDERVPLVFKDSSPCLTAHAWGCTPGCSGSSFADLRVGKPTRETESNDKPTPWALASRGFMRQRVLAHGPLARSGPRFSTRDGQKVVWRRGTSCSHRPDIRMAEYGGPKGAVVAFCAVHDAASRRSPARRRHAFAASARAPAT